MEEDRGGGRPGEKGAGGVRQAGSGIKRWREAREKRKIPNIAQYFAIEKMPRGGSQQIQGVREAGGLTPCTPPPRPN